MVFPLASATFPTVTVPHQTSPGFSVQVLGTKGGGAGVTGSDSAAAPAPTAPTARSSNVYAVPLMSPFTVNPAWFAPPGALFAIGVQVAG